MQYFGKNLDRVREQNRKYNKKRQATASWRNAYLLKTYGITQADYDIILAKQNHSCAICGKGKGNRRMAVDHCHKTGKIRGLLCIMCNTALGMVENKTWMKLAGTYVGRPAEVKDGID